MFQPELPLPSLSSLSSLSSLPDDLAELPLPVSAPAPDVESADPAIIIDSLRGSESVGSLQSSLSESAACDSSDWASCDV